MILFTIIGAIVWFAFWGQIGYGLALYFDGKQQLRTALKPLDDSFADLEAFAFTLTQHNRGVTSAAPQGDKS